jgi:hypothetical protein
MDILNLDYISINASKDIKVQGKYIIYKIFINKT